jgi:hypothetical protein
MKLVATLLFALSCTASADLNLDISDAAARARASSACDSSQLKLRSVGGLEKAAVVQTYCAEAAVKDCDPVIAKTLRADFVDLAFDCGSLTADAAKKKTCMDTLDKRLDGVSGENKGLERATPVQEPAPEVLRETADRIAQAHPGRKADVTLFKSEIDSYIRASKGAKFEGHRSTMVLGDDIRRCLREDELLNIRLQRALDRLNAKTPNAGTPGGVSR